MWNEEEHPCGKYKSKRVYPRKRREILIMPLNIIREQDMLQ